MHIEKQIPESYFRNQRHKTVLNIILTASWLIEHVKHMLIEEDVTPQQYNILRILQNHGAPMSTLKIREKMLDKMSDTSRIVERLIKKGLVDKKPSLTDKRLVDVTITENGEQLLLKLENINIEIDSLVSNLDDAEVESINTMLDKIRDKD